MKNYNAFSLKDFVLDKDFQQWIIDPQENDIRFWSTYLQKNPQQVQTIEEAKKVILSLPFPVYKITDEQTEKVWQKIQQQIQNEAIKYDKIFDISRKQARYWPNWYNYAAAFLLLTMVSFAFFYLSNWNNKIEITNQYGQIRKITLPDGSKVLLNANSSLSYYENWQKREVWLNGEGFFEVSKAKSPTDDLAKFTVHTPELDVQVLGTEFNVKTRHQKTEVVLNSGKIVLKKDAKLYNIEPGERVIATSGKSSIDKQIVDTAFYSTWREQKFAFQNTRLTDILEMLKDDYGYELVQNNQDLGDKKISSTDLISTKDIKAFVQVVASLYQVEIMIEGKKIKVNKR
jgi:ferric-dicitrate binding protein FerR (iron transport regulator)